MSEKNRKENRHSAIDFEQCKIMAKLNGWKLLYVEPNGSQILKVDCVFEGQQTSFALTEKDYE
jgi:hypothetical protein